MFLEHWKNSLLPPIKRFYRAAFPTIFRKWIALLRGQGRRIQRKTIVDIEVQKIRPESGMLSDLKRFEKSVSSQNGEDGILEVIFAKIGTTNRYFVEFGVENGLECNSATLLTRGWDGLQMDAADGNPDYIKKEFIFAETINEVFRKYTVPPLFDLLSIDIDGNDYWVWKAIKGFMPRVVVIEYNGSIPPSESLVIPYDPNFRYDNTLPMEPAGYAFFGASLAALEKLGREKGYTLVYCESTGVNAFFVQKDLASAHFAPKTLNELYRHHVHPHSHKTIASWQSV
jgi:hypothetical protein